MRMKNRTNLNHILCIPVYLMLDIYPTLKPISNLLNKCLKLTNFHYVRIDMAKIAAIIMGLRLSSMLELSK